MYYYDVYLRNAPDFYTWEAKQAIPIGSRVRLKFQNQPRIGIIIRTSEKKPSFVTLPILEILEESFIDQRYLQLAQEISAENFTIYTKVLSLMIPEAFCLEQNPAERQLHYQLKSIPDSLRGAKQKEALQLIQKNNGKN